MLIFPPVRSTLDERGFPEVWCGGCGACVAYYGHHKLYIVHDVEKPCCGLFNTETGHVEEVPSPYDYYSDEELIDMMRHETEAEMAWLRHAERATWDEMRERF